MSPVRCESCPPRWCTWKQTPWDASQNAMVTLRGSARGGLKRTQRFAGAVMTLTPEGTKGGGSKPASREPRRGTCWHLGHQVILLGVKNVDYLCAFLFQPSRRTTSRDEVRQNRGAWLAERGADVGRTESRTKDWVEQQSRELWLLLAAHLLDQDHLKTVKHNENPPVSWV